MSEVGYDVFAQRLSALESEAKDARASTNAFRVTVVDDLHKLQQQVAMGDQAHGYIKAQIADMAADVKQLVGDRTRHQGTADAYQPFVDLAFKVACVVVGAVVVFKLGLGK